MLASLSSKTINSCCLSSSSWQTIFFHTSFTMSMTVSSKAMSRLGGEKEITLSSSLSSVASCCCWCWLRPTWVYSSLHRMGSAAAAAFSVVVVMLLSLLLMDISISTSLRMAALRSFCPWVPGMLTLPYIIPLFCSWRISNGNKQDQNQKPNSKWLRTSRQAVFFLNNKIHVFRQCR